MISTGCSSPCGGGGNCDLGDCLDQISVNATLAVTQDKLVGTTAMLCRNNICATGTLATAGSGSVVQEGLLTGATFKVQVMASDQGGATLVTFDYYSDGTIGGDSDYNDGDLFHASITDPGGTILLDAARAAQYTLRDSPCGSSYVCHKLDMSLN